MDSNRILTVGFSLSWRSSRFLDMPNLNEFDAVIWAANQTLMTEVAASNPILMRNVEAYQTRLANLIKWLGRGHTLVVITSPLKTISYPNTSGVLKSFVLQEHSPFSGMSIEEARGELIEFCGLDSMKALLAPSVGDLHYSATIKSSDLVALFKVSRGRFGNDELVGGYRRVGSGLVIFAPPWRDKLTGQQIELYLSNLVTLSDHLPGNAPDQFPPWVANYQTELEKAAAEKINKLEAKIIDLNSQVRIEEQTVRSDQHLKQLFAGSGEAFAAAVAEALRGLGLKIVEGPRGRADLIGYNGKLLFAFEAKGLDATAREHNLRQTERWVADIMSALTATDEQKAADKDLELYAQKLSDLGVLAGDDLECKGVMIIGTHRKTPISERSDLGFPDPVARPINRSRVCALSGLQLLGLLLECRSGRKQASDILDQIHGTNGVFNDAADWRAFLSETIIAEAK